MGARAIVNEEFSRVFERRHVDYAGRRGVGKRWRPLITQVRNLFEPTLQS
jgi:hypothetical protein